MGVIRVVDDAGAADVVLDDPTSPPSRLWRQLAESPAVQETLETAARSLVAGAAPDQARIALEELGVDALAGLFATAVVDAVDLEGEDDPAVLEAIDELRREAVAGVIDAALQEAVDDDPLVADDDVEHRPDMAGTEDLTRPDVSYLSLEGENGQICPRGARLEAAVDELLADLPALGTWSALHAASRSLGGQTTLGPSGGVDAILDGPTALLAASGVEPTVAVDLGSDFMSQSSEERAHQLRFLMDLSRGFCIELVCGPVISSALCHYHDTDLPASLVNELANQSHKGTGVGGVQHPVRRDDVDDALDLLGWDHPAWALLETVVEEPREERTYSALYADVRLGDVTKSAIRKQIGRLAEAGLVERARDGDRHVVRLTETGLAAAQARFEDVGGAGSSGARDSDARGRQGGSADGGAVNSPVKVGSEAPSESGGGKRDAPAGEGTGTGGPAGGVNDPPKRSAEAVFSPCEGEGPPSAESGGRSDPQTAFLPFWRHDGAGAVVEDCDVGLVDHPVAPKDHPGDRWVSFLEEREEIVVEVEGHHSRMANTAVRLAAALTSKELMFEKTNLAARMDDGGPFQGFDVPTDDPLETRILLRKGHCLGYLPDSIEYGGAYVNRLRAERRELLQEANQLVGADGDYCPGIAQHVLPDAVGLACTMIRIYELVGIDVVCHLTFPEWNRNVNPKKVERRSSIRDLLAFFTTINGTHGLYPLYRTVFEDREEKRDDALQGPGVDPDDPTGELLGSWVLSGPGIDDFADDLEAMAAGWEPHPDALDAQQEFYIDLDVRQGWRREVAVRAANRLIKRQRLRVTLTPEATSTLVGFLGSPFSVPRALNRLGQEPMERRIELDEVRWALSTLPEWELLPAAPPAARSIVATLLEADESLSTAALAEAADVEPATVRGHRDRLEALGLLVVDEQGPGRATLHRLTLPTREERHDPDAPRPALLDLEGPLAHAVEEALNRLGDSIAAHRPRLWSRIWPADGDDVDEVWKSDRWGWLRSWGDTLAGLTGEEVGGRLEEWSAGPYRRRVQLGERLERSESRQLSLDEALGLVPAD